MTSKKSKTGKGASAEPAPEGVEATEEAASAGAGSTKIPAEEKTAEAPAQPDPGTLLAEANDKLLRTKAEFENYRKRVQREFAEIREQTKILVIGEFLTVYDHFQMALSHADSEDVASLRQGMQLIQAEFGRTLENLGAQQIDAVGLPFDPAAHEAIAQEPAAEVPEGHVLRQWKAGFRIGERLLRPAAVVVSSGAPDTKSDADTGKK